MGRLDEALEHAQDAEAHFIKLKEGEHPSQYTIFSTLSHMMQAGIQAAQQNDDIALRLYAGVLERLEAIEELTKSGQGGLEFYSKGLNYDLVGMYKVCKQFVLGGNEGLEAYRQSIARGEEAPSIAILDLKNVSQM